MQLLQKILLKPVIAVDTAEAGLGFKIPTIGDILTFAIRLFFIIAGLTALFFLLTGALQWITSGGNKENVDKARERIQQAVIGVILIIVVLAIVAVLEQTIFAKKFCFGITCAIDFKQLELLNK